MRTRIFKIFAVLSIAVCCGAPTRCRAAGPGWERDASWSSDLALRTGVAAPDAPGSLHQIHGAAKHGSVHPGKSSSLEHG